MGECSYINYFLSWICFMRVFINRIVCDFLNELLDGLNRVVEFVYLVIEEL